MRLFRIVRAILREIFEESAYERFCAREGLPRGQNSYADFQRESNAARTTRVRCC